MEAETSVQQAIQNFAALQQPSPVQPLKASEVKQ
jgi:hypothetical protein